MPSVCEVCSSQPSKYRCPQCGLMSCSLACTQSHKINCATKASEPSSERPSDEARRSDLQRGPQTNINGVESEETPRTKPAPFNPQELGSSPDLKDLFLQFPQLRSVLRDIYQSTLEQEWTETDPTSSYTGRSRPHGRHRGGGGYRQNRGPWTPEKGFRRGLGKVRKLRERCNAGLETGPTAEAFVRFMALVNDDGELRS